MSVSTIQVHLGLLKAIKRKDLIPDYYGAKEDGFSINLDLSIFKPDEIELLKKEASYAYQRSRNGNEKDKWQGIAATYTKLLNYSKIVKSEVKNDASGIVVTDLRSLETALRKYVNTSPQRWVFLRLKDDSMVPFYVRNIEYIPGKRDEEGRVEVEMLHESKSGETIEKSFNYYKSDFYNDFNIAPSTEEIAGEEDDDEEGAKVSSIKKQRGNKGVPVSVFCKHKHMYIGTKEMYDEYKAQINKYLEFQGTTGIVVTTKDGEAKACYASATSSWRNDDIAFESYRHCGAAGASVVNLVTDENGEEKISEESYYSWYKSSRNNNYGRTCWPDGSGSALIPIHPRVKCFDFGHQTHCLIHIDQIVKKTFDKNLSDKLVLPERDKMFIDMLMETASTKMEDIVAGKSGGVSILSSGPPGTGKTLTAEVTAESQMKPLYSVQCSELGIDPENLEKNLKKVLRRAERWKAVLMLDEADVYVRERGDDIQQNAIVGVFLRVLEYYSGILFMTTNKNDGDIDDAIMSRCIAHLRYSNFSGDTLKSGWEVLSAQYEVKLTKADIEKLIKWKSEVSGRSIKNLLKLARKYSAARKEKIDFEIIKLVSEYLPAFKK